LSGAEGEHICPQPWVVRGECQDVPSLWHAGDEADHSRAIEARDAVFAYIRSARVTNRFSIEQHRDGSASGRPGLDDEFHLARYKRNDNLAAALLEFDILAVGTPV